MLYKENIFIYLQYFFFSPKPSLWDKTPPEGIASHYHNDCIYHCLNIPSFVYPLIVIRWLKKKMLTLFLKKIKLSANTFFFQIGSFSPCLIKKYSFLSTVMLACLFRF